MPVELILSICLGVGLAASSGFRVFVPAFALSIAAYFEVIVLSDSWAWLGSGAALIILGVASIVESLGYLVPWVDNLLDVIAVPLAGLAGTLMMAASMTDLSPAMTWALAIVAGGGAATAVKATNATGRAISTATTAGTINPAIGMAETGAAIGLSALAIFTPILAMLAVLIGLVMFIWLIIKMKKRANA